MMATSLLDELAAAALTLVTPAPTAHVLDVEAGLGALTLLVARRVARVDALDGSHAIVLALRARVSVAGLGNVVARVGDAAALPFVEQHFDAAYFLSVVSSASRAAVLAELRRVLKPGAPAVVAAASERERDELLEDIVVAGFDEVQAHAVDAASGWLVVGLA
jgi:ubiquinone/menaquinone biosynthesis C-methylase UbiE